jgi:hypothetical protein
LYGCETWSFTLREENRLKLFENMVLKRITGPKRGDVTVEWRKLHSVEFNPFYPSPNIIRVIKLRIMRWVEQAAFMGREKCTEFW